MKLLHLIALLFLGVTTVNAASRLESSVVKIEITQKEYNYHQPWTLSVDHYYKSGAVIEGSRILTTAEYLNNSTLIRVQKGGQGTWYAATVIWRDYHANLALISVESPEFWKGLKAVALDAKPRKEGAIQLVRWNDGDLETRKATIHHVEVNSGKISNLDQLFLMLESDIKGGGWSEIAFRGSKIVGLVCSQSDNTSYAIPAPWIKSLLDDQAKGNYRGLGFFDFQWNRTLNPETVSYLKLPGKPRGVIISGFVDDRNEGRLLHKDDLLLKIDGFAIDSTGKYDDPNYGPVILEYIAIRNHRIGDIVPITLWRDGMEITIDYKLPAFDEKLWLCPQYQLDHAPEYLIVAGLLFQPLNDNYMSKWDPKRNGSPPVNLLQASYQKATDAIPARVVLSYVIPIPANVGYQDLNNMILDRVNGRAVYYLDDLTEAMKYPQDGYHIFEFEQYSEPSRIILKSASTGENTALCLKQFSISSDHFIIDRDDAKP